MEVFEISLSIAIILFVAALLSGFIDTLVGGGGLITLPALMMVGVPPIFALGTNKLQAAVGSGTATLSLSLRKRLQFKELKILMLAAFSGALVGATLVQFFDAQLLSFVIPSVVVLIAVYFVLAPTQSLTSREARMSSSRYAASAVPGVGLYDGMFGPGTGSFFVLAGVTLRGQAIVKSTIHAKPLNFATNLAALLVFIGFGKVLWAVGALMMAGQFVGANLGSKVLLDIKPELLRYLVIAVCFSILLAWGVNTYA